MTIGERVKKRRQELGISVDDLAAKLGKNRATVYRYESNAIENLPTSVLEPLAKALDTTPEYLIGWTDSPIDYENSEEVLNAPLDVIEEFDGDAEKIYNFMRAVDEDREHETAPKTDEQPVYIKKITGRVIRLSEDEQKKAWEILKTVFGEGESP